MLEISSNGCMSIYGKEDDAKIEKDLNLYTGKGSLESESAEEFSIAKDRYRKAILTILYTAIIKY